MNVWRFAWKLVDTLLGVAIKADELAERRRARRRFEELVERRGPGEQTLRSRAPTVITTRRAAAPAASPTAPTRPERGR